MAHFRVPLSVTGDPAHVRRRHAGVRDAIGRVGAAAGADRGSAEEGGRLVRRIGSRGRGGKG